MTTRREFLTDLCKLCAFAGVAGISASMLTSCNTIKSATATAEGDQLRVALTAFGEGTQLLVRSSKTNFDILAHKRPDNTYGAILMECTHQQQPLTASGTSLYCSSHGSKFDLEGKVLIPPATKPLTKYAATVSGNDLLITLKPI